MDRHELREEEGIQVDDLAAGITRPAKMGGVPMKPLVIGLFGVVAVFMGTGKPLYLLLGVPVFIILRLISSSYPRIFAEIAAWFRVNARCINRLFWGGIVSFSPRRTDKWEKR